MTKQRFGKVIRLRAALPVQRVRQQLLLLRILRDNPILLVTLSLDEVRQEAREF